MRGVKITLVFLSFCFIFHAGREENHITEPDDTLIDECCLLPSQLLIPNIDWLPINDGIISKLQNKQLVRLQFGKAPGLIGHTVSSQFDAFVRYKDVKQRGGVVEISLGGRWVWDACVTSGFILFAPSH